MATNEPQLLVAQLEPKFLGWAPKTPNDWPWVENIRDAKGVRFLCPKCFLANGRSNIGVHRVICWTPDVPKEIRPGPGRWRLEGKDFASLTLVAGSSSVHLRGGCGAHFFIKKGKIQMC